LPVDGADPVSLLIFVQAERLAGKVGGSGLEKGGVKSGGGGSSSSSSKLKGRLQSAVAFADASGEQMQMLPPSQLPSQAPTTEDSFGDVRGSGADDSQLALELSACSPEAASDDDCSGDGGLPTCI
jgi:hypothetical protein